MENQKKTLIITFIGVIAFIIAIAGVSYAFFTYTVNTSGDDKTNTVVKSANLDAEFKDGALLNISDMIPGDTFNKEFTVSNTGDGVLNFKVVMQEVSNNFNSNDIELSLYEGESLIKTVPFPTSTSAISDSLTINAKESKDYTVVITYKNTDVDQASDMGNSASGKLYIEEVK